MPFIELLSIATNCSESQPIASLCSVVRTFKCGELFTGSVLLSIYIFDIFPHHCGFEQFDSFNQTLARLTSCLAVHAFIYGTTDLGIPTW